MNESMNAADAAAMEEPGYRHYVRLDGDNIVVHGFSDEFETPGETDILINDKGGRHFRLVIDGKETHENPWELIRDERGACLLKWDGKAVVRRGAEELREDAAAAQVHEPQPHAALAYQNGLELGAEERLSLVEDAVRRHEAAMKSHEAAIGAITETLPKARQEQVLSARKAMLGGAEPGASNG